MLSRRSADPECWIDRGIRPGLARGRVISAPASGKNPTAAKDGIREVLRGVRILLIALLLFGSTGSLLCEAACARADSQSAALAAIATAAAPDHAACHGSDVPVREQAPADSGDPCEAGCCSLLTLATVSPPTAPGLDSVWSPLLACEALHQIRERSNPTPVSRAAGPPGPPFRFRNLPLLI